MKLPCGKNETPLFSLITNDLLHEKNLRVKLACCELLANLSLGEEYQAMAEENDNE